MPTISKGLTQAYELQDLAFDAAMSFRKSIQPDGSAKIAREDAVSISNLVKAWESCQLRIQFHRRVPSPGTLKPTKKTPVWMSQEIVQPADAEPIEPASTPEQR